MRKVLLLSLSRVRFQGFVGGRRDLLYLVHTLTKVAFPCLLLAACAVLGLSKKGSGYSICAYVGCNLRTVVAHPLCVTHTLEQDSALFPRLLGLNPVRIAGCCLSVSIPSAVTKASNGPHTCGLCGGVSEALNPLKEVRPAQVASLGI